MHVAFLSIFQRSALEPPPRVRSLWPPPTGGNRVLELDILFCKRHACGAAAA